MEAVKICSWKLKTFYLTGIYLFIETNYNNWIRNNKNARKMEKHVLVMGDIKCKIGDLRDGSKEEISKGG